MTLLARVTLLGCLACCAWSADAQTTGAPAANRFVEKIWRVEEPSDAAPGSIYVFLSNGTVLQTSCVEVYRVSEWRSRGAGKLTITEDLKPIEVEIEQRRNDTLRMRFKLGGSWQPWKTLTTIQAPFVCPDLKR